MHLSTKIPGPLTAQRQFVLGILISIASLCLLCAGGAPAPAQTANQTQQNALGPGGQSTVASPSVLKAREEDLRRRAEEFYQLLQARRVAEAEAYVAPDSKDKFLQESRSNLLGFKVDTVHLDPDGRKAVVSVQMQVMMGGMGGPVKMPHQTQWNWVDGLWYLVIQAPNSGGGDVKSLFQAPHVQGKTPPEDLKFKDHEYGMGKIPVGQVATARFPFTNAADHAVTLSSINTFCDCLRAKIAKKEFKPGESGELDVEFDSKGFSQQYAQTIVVKTDPGNRTVYLSVLAFVVAPAAPLQKVSPKQKTNAGSAP